MPSIQGTPNPLAKLGVDTSNIGTSATSRGTKIVKPSDGMDKNSFFKILASELANQNPDKAKDGTEYVSQLAQFSGLEQMANLNSTMRFSGASSLIGKGVVLNSLDNSNNNYMGKVKAVTKSGENIKIDVIIGETTAVDGTKRDVVKTFKIEDIYQIS